MKKGVYAPPELSLAVFSAESAVATGSGYDDGGKLFESSGNSWNDGFSWQ